MQVQGYGCRVCCLGQGLKLRVFGCRVQGFRCRAGRLGKTDHPARAASRRRFRRDCTGVNAWRLWVEGSRIWGLGLGVLPYSLDSEYRLITPTMLPYIIPYIPHFQEFKLQLNWNWEKSSTQPSPQNSEAQAISPKP